MKKYQVVVGFDCRQGQLIRRRNTGEVLELHECEAQGLLLQGNIQEIKTPTAPIKKSAKRSQ